MLYRVLSRYKRQQEFNFVEVAGSNSPMSESQHVQQNNELLALQELETVKRCIRRPLLVLSN